jgi:tRNA/tmRNA/rRNA uracil-C5-methylase (TrmA/RlmC/RlmD family)
MSYNETSTKGKTMNEKFAKLKKKVKDNSGNIAVFTATAVAASVAYAIHKANQRLEESNQVLREANDELEDVNSMMMTLLRAVRQARETGESVTMYNERGNPLFDVSAPSED